MKEFDYKDHKLHLVRSTYRTNSAIYIGLYDDKNELFIDITVNTPYSTKNTIVVSADFISLEKEYVDNVINYLTEGKIREIECGFSVLSKYWLNMKVLDEIEEL